MAAQGGSCPELAGCHWLAAACRAHRSCTEPAQIPAAAQPRQCTGRRVLPSVLALHLDVCSYSVLVNPVQEFMYSRHVVHVLIHAIGNILIQLDGQLDLITMLTLQRAQEVATRVIELLR